MLEFIKDNMSYFIYMLTYLTGFCLIYDVIRKRKNMIGKYNKKQKIKDLVVIIFIIITIIAVDVFVLHLI